MRLFIFIFLLLSREGYSQQRIIDHAVITTISSVNMPDAGSAPPPPPGIPGGGDQMIVINGIAAGEDNKVITWYSDNLIKIVTDMGMGRNTIIIDTKNKRTTTLIEAMGTKTGFYSTEEDDKELKKRLDSLTGTKKNEISNVLIDYINPNVTKKISGFECKKALIKTVHENGIIDSQYVWYTPSIKMGAGFSFKSGMMASTIFQGFDKLDGFPVKYETITLRGMKITVEVIKVDTEKIIDKKEFEIPKDFVVKAMKDMQGSGAPGTFQLRIGGH